MKETYTLDEVRKIVEFTISMAVIMKSTNSDIKQMLEITDDIINIRTDQDG